MYSTVMVLRWFGPMPNRFTRLDLIFSILTTHILFIYHALLLLLGNGNNVKDKLGEKKEEEME